MKVEGVVSTTVENSAGSVMSGGYEELFFYGGWLGMEGGSQGSVE